jgi:hypothetical protein
MKGMPAPEDRQPALVLALVRDLMFMGRINSTARAVGVPLKVIRDPAKLAGEAGRRLVVDLNLAGAIEAAGAWLKAAGGDAREVVGFVSHTDAATIARARAAGVERVLPRSRFAETLPNFLVGAP